MESLLWDGAWVFQHQKHCHLKCERAKRVTSGMSGAESVGQYALKKKEPTLEVDDNTLMMLEAECCWGCTQLK